MSKSDAEALLRQGIQLYDLGRFQESIVMFDRALALFPRLPKAHYFKGIALSTTLANLKTPLSPTMLHWQLILLIPMHGITRQPPLPSWGETKRHL